MEVLARAVAAVDETKRREMQNYSNRMLREWDQKNVVIYWEELKQAHPNLGKAICMETAFECALKYE